MTAEIHTLRTTAVTDGEAAVHKLEKILQHAREGHVQAVGRCDRPRQCNLVRQRRGIITRRSFITAISHAEYTEIGVCPRSKGSVALKGNENLQMIARRGGLYVGHYAV
jgi:hypothetical protein